MGLFDGMFNGGGGLFGNAIGSIQDMAQRGETAPGMLDSGAFLLNAYLNNAQKMTSGFNGAQSYDEAGFNFPSQSASVPAPPPRPDMPAGPIFGGPGLPQSAMGGGYGGGAFAPAPTGSAALPPNATPTQGQMPPQAQNAMAQAQPEVGFGDRLMAGVNNMSSGGNPLAMLANVAQGFATGTRTDATGIAQQNRAQTAQAVATGLIQSGYKPEVAMAIAKAASTDPKIAEKLLGDAFATPKTMEELVTRQAAQGSRGGSPGQAPSSPMANYEDFLKRQSAAKKSGDITGERTANAELDLPSAVAQGKEALRLVGELRTHKGRDNGIFWHGKTSAYLPDSAIPGNTDARDAVSILGQIKGGAFLEAFKALKGGGQITEVEGKKATEAITRMDRSQSRAEFDRALSDYEGVIKLGIDRANQQAGREAPGGFKGNSEWQQVKPGIRIRQVN